MNEQPADEQQAEQGSVFGNLPSSRPGTRSPRRDRATEPKQARASARKPAPPRPSGPQFTAQPRPQPAPAADTDPREEPAVEESGGLDDLAWAGVAAVAEAATFGVRLANRALGALRDGVDRR